ncbi:MAG TPA: GntR family transcriptional regulator [Rhodopila sp.]|nr:GntR family transcriptional regulator [Rhodopila sp.]
MLLRDHVYKAIRLSILNGDLKPGQEVREQVLADKHRVSRSPVRDALLRLEQEHLVTVLPRRGYLINAVTAADCKEIYGVRLLLEPACATAAAERDDIAVRTLDRFRWAADIPDQFPNFIDYNTAFHKAVCELSGNTRLAGIMCHTMEQVARLQRLYPDRFAWPLAGQHVRAHEALIDAIQAHDCIAAAEQATQHVQAAVGAMLRDLAASEAARTPADEPESRPTSIGLCNADSTAL